MSLIESSLIPDRTTRVCVSLVTTASTVSLTSMNVRRRRVRTAPPAGSVRTACERDSIYPQPTATIACVLLDLQVSERKTK